MKSYQHATAGSLVERAVGINHRGLSLVIVSLVGTALAFLLVANRIYWRLALYSRIGFDDAAVLVAMTFLCVQCVATILAVSYGYGMRFAELQAQDAVMALKFFYIEQIFYKLTMNFTKISVLLLYLRIFSGPKWFIKSCYIMIAVVLVGCFGFTTMTIIQCWPLEFIWDRRITTGVCIHILPFWYGNAGYSIGTDFIILFMVLPVIYALKLPFRQKLALTAVFSIGLVVCIASILRLTTLATSAYGSDITAGSLVSTGWTAGEAEVAVICACLPMLRVPLQRLFPRVFPSYITRTEPIDQAEQGGGGTSHQLLSLNSTTQQTNPSPTTSTTPSLPYIPTQPFDPLSFPVPVTPPRPIVNPRPTYIPTCCTTPTAAESPIPIQPPVTDETLVTEPNRQYRAGLASNYTLRGRREWQLCSPFGRYPNQDYTVNPNRPRGLIRPTVPGGVREV